MTVEKVNTSSKKDVAMAAIGLGASWLGGGAVEKLMKIYGTPFCSNKAEELVFKAGCWVVGVAVGQVCSHAMKKEAESILEFVGTFKMEDGSEAKVYVKQ